MSYVMIFSGSLCNPPSSLLQHSIQSCIFQLSLSHLAYQTISIHGEGYGQRRFHLKEVPETERLIITNKFKILYISMLWGKNPFYSGETISTFYHKSHHLCDSSLMIWAGSFSEWTENCAHCCAGKQRQF